MNNDKNNTICMLGGGAWGTAVATLLAHNGYDVVLWCNTQDVADDIAAHHINSRYLPGVPLPKNIMPTTDISYALCASNWVFEAVPVQYLRSVLVQAVQCFTQDQTWVVLSKGIEKDTLMVPTQIIADVLGANVQQAVFAGPSFAKEVAMQQHTAVTIASHNCDVGIALQHMLANDYFRPYGSLDVVGVQLGAALKNVITLCIGLLDGAGYNDNTKAFFMTRGLHEMAELIVAAGGKQETAYGLSGVGDLVLTSMGSLSRNLEVGKRLGRGQSLHDVIKETGYTPEGINTVQSMQAYATKLGCDLPLCTGVYKVIFDGQSVDAMVREFMERPLEWECGV